MSKVGNPCSICPSLYLCKEEYNVITPRTDEKYVTAADTDYRVDRQGIPTCIHPGKLGVRVTVMIERPSVVATDEIVPNEEGQLAPWIQRNLEGSDQHELQQMVEAVNDLAATHFDDNVLSEAFKRAFEAMSANS